MVIALVNSCSVMRYRLKGTFYIFVMGRGPAYIAIKLAKHLGHRPAFLDSLKIYDASHPVLPSFFLRACAFPDRGVCNRAGCRFSGARPERKIQAPQFLLQIVCLLGCFDISLFKLLPSFSLSSIYLYRYIYSPLKSILIYLQDIYKAFILH
jgi:hypothetical protein